MSKPTIADGKLPSLFASLHLTSPHLLFRQEQWRPQQWLNQILRQAFGNIWRQDNPSNATVAKRVQADTKCICYTGQDPQILTQTLTPGATTSIADFLYYPKSSSRTCAFVQQEFLLPQGASSLLCTLFWNLTRSNEDFSHTRKDPNCPGINIRLYAFGCNVFYHIQCPIFHYFYSSLFFNQNYWLLPPCVLHFIKGKILCPRRVFFFFLR